MNFFFNLARFFYLMVPWLLEACGFSFVLPLVVSPEAFTALSRTLVFVVVLIIGSYYDRRLWQSHGENFQSKPTLQVKQILLPVLFYLVAGFVFSLVSLMDNYFGN
jgi:hypothetical protein